MDLKEQIKNYREEMIANLAKIISYRSVLGPEEENAPYGIENLKCLEEALKMGINYGMKTKNLDGHCGYIEIGEGKEIIGILTHLDVVPEGNGWNTNPFEIAIKDNKVYGRGTSDDKGAFIASLTALKIILDNKIPLNKRVRLIVGCNEESGSNCMKYYVKKEGNIDIGFTPDGDFPLVHGEKGMIKAVFKCKTDSSFKIEGGVVVNAVSDNCKVEIDSSLYDKEKLKEYFVNNNIDYSVTSIENKDVIIVKGLSAHASTPEFGINAISHAILALQYSGYENDLIKFYSKYISLETDGKSFGIKCNDEYGNLTLVNGIIKTENNEIEGTLDIRIPVSLEVNHILNIFKNNNYGNANIEVQKVVDKLFYQLDSKLVKTLMKAYRDVTKDMKSKPITMGGGTYAKTMKNCIAFGCSFPNTNNQIHNANEFVVIDELLLQVEIYINAILGLLNI